MKHRSILLGAVLLSLLGGTAQAQVNCKAYADQMVALDQRARQMKCPDWSSHSNWNAHLDWCTKQPLGQADGALGRWNGRLDGCMSRLNASAGPRPAAPAVAAKPKVDESRRPVCTSFARYAVQWRNAAVQRSCNVAALPDPNFNRSEQHYFDYCMNTSDGEFRNRSPQALGHKGALEKACSLQLKRPFAL